MKYNILKIALKEVPKLEQNLKNISCLFNNYVYTSTINMFVKHNLISNIKCQTIIYRNFSNLKRKSKGVLYFL